MGEFGEPSAKLGFGWFDDMVTDGGQPEGKEICQLPPEEVCEDRRGEEVVEDGESESKSREETKPPAVDEYRWQWKASDPGSLLVAPY